MLPNHLHKRKALCNPMMMSPRFAILPHFRERGVVL